MDFGNTPTTKLTERIMAEISEHLLPDPPGQPTHYNRVYETVHRHVLAHTMVDRIAQQQRHGGGH